MVVVVMTSCLPGYNVIRVTKDAKPTKKAGFYYMLPQTYFKITVKVVQKENIKGPYSEYAAKYLGLKNIITENATSYQIADVEIISYSEPDTSQFYFVETNCKKLGVDIDYRGYLKAINPKRIKKIETEQNYYKDNVKDTKDNGDIPELFKNFVELNMYEKVDTMYRDVEGDTGIVRETILKKTIVEKPTEQKAKEMVDFINKLKETRFSYLNGDQDVKDKSTLEFIYNELDKQENDYLKLFSGITVKHTLTYTFYYLPQKDTSAKVTTVNNAPLFKFSASKGVLDLYSKEGDYVNINVSSKGCLYNTNIYNKQKESLNKGKHGFAYRIPEFSEVIISYHNNILKDYKTSISQFGIVVNLPRSTRSIEYDTFSGSVEKLRLH